MDSDSDQATQQVSTGSSKKQSKKMAGEKEFKGSPFAYGEKVYCDLGDIVYEGKVERRRANDSSYLVHYLGWNKTWDEWLPEEKLFKMEDVDILKQVAEGKKTIQQPGKSAKVKSSKNVKIKSSVKKVKQNNHSQQLQFSMQRHQQTLPVQPSKPRPIITTQNKEVEKAFIIKEKKPSTVVYRDFKIVIPEELRYVLASDSDLIQKGFLFKLPAQLTASQIMANFEIWSIGSGINNRFQVSEVMAGVRSFFNVVCETRLLYNAEYPQFQNVMRQESPKEPADVYGSAHLLRLMVIIGAMLKDTGIRLASDVLLIEGIVTEFLNYLEEERGNIFTSRNYAEGMENS